MHTFSYNHPHTQHHLLFYMNTVPHGATLVSLLREENDVPIVAFVDACIREAHLARSSDIHFEPREQDVCIRLRIDGILREHATFPKTMLPEVISRIKVLSSLRTDEHQAAQDGRFRHVSDSDVIDVRVSITPTYYGENAVLRLLVSASTGFTLASLGFNESDASRITRALTRTHGMILATGPTGSGKTTTLYTLMQLLNVRDVSIVTIEDPIEYAIPNVTQISVNARTGLTFAHGLKSILRQDPNIIMVGEIRDSETASVAINTALTGHLLLSTVHTNDAATTLPRLLDMDVDAYLVASTMSIAIGQRLVRTICPACKDAVNITQGEREHILRLYEGEPPPVLEQFYVGRGCDACGGSGYRGRIGIYEVLEISPRMRELILNHASSQEIKRAAVEEGMTPMFNDGLEKASRGVTTLSELLRTVHE